MTPEERYASQRRAIDEFFVTQPTWALLMMRSFAGQFAREGHRFEGVMGDFSYHSDDVIALNHILTSRNYPAQETADEAAQPPTP